CVAGCVPCHAGLPRRLAILHLADRHRDPRRPAAAVAVRSRRRSLSREPRRLVPDGDNRQHRPRTIAGPAVRRAAGRRRAARSRRADPRRDRAATRIRDGNVAFSLDAWTAHAAPAHDWGRGTWTTRHTVTLRKSAS